jgi:hypothetical protein
VLAPHPAAAQQASWLHSARQHGTMLLGPKVIQMASIGTWPAMAMVRHQPAR